MKKESDDMGKVWADIEVINAGEEYAAANGALAKYKVRRINVNALVDTGATILVLPEKDIIALGLQLRRTTRSRFAEGKSKECKIYGPVTVRFCKRTMQTEAMQGPANIPPLLGQIPMEGLDVLVDPKNQRLVLNMESGDPEMALVEVYTQLFEPEI